ncbi:MAG: hypothetical protein V8R92_03850 [Eubacterium sp.]|uniref:hypothetical protein n=1 Tax=Eubacterium sp. TaxID=142586 RepID=UPI00300F0094
MKFNKISRKVLAYACATAMVFSSVSAYQVLQVSAYEESDYTTLENEKNTTVGDWTLYAGKWKSNTGEMAYAGSTVDDLSLKIISSDGNSGCWKLQAKHIVTGLTKDTTYDLKLKVNSSKAGVLYEKIETPEVIKKGIEIKEGENEVTVQFKATSESTGMVLELSGIPSGTVLDFGGITCTEATEIETTTEQQADAEGYYSSSKSQWTTSLPWQVYTVGSMKYKGTATKNAVTADFKFLEAGGGDWNTQARVPADKQVFGPLEASGDGVNYKVKVAYTSTATFGANLQLNGVDNKVTFEEGTHELNLDYVSKADYPVIFMNLGNAVANSQLTFTMTFTKDGETETTTESTETTTEAVETTTESTETTTEAAETTTEAVETTTESTETTTESTETTTEKQEPVEITMDQEFNADGDRELGGYTIYVGQSWNGSTAVAGVDAEDADHIKVQQKTSNWGQAWGLQVKKEFSGLVPGAKYSISWKINAESNDGKVLVTNNEAQIALVGGEQVLTGEFTATESGTGEFVVGMGWVGLTNPIEFFAPEITKISDPETTTENTETTTEAPETTKAQEETTTKSAETTTAKTATTTTVAPTTTAPATTVAQAKVTVKKVAIKKATKKKSAKKASIVLKKVSGVAGYQVKVSTSKKFAKKTTVTVNAKSVKVTVKKLKANKTYYVKARAYKKVSGSKVYGKWSKVIKIANK